MIARSRPGAAARGISELRRWGRASLKQGSLELSFQARGLEVDVLLAHALGVEREQLLTHPEEAPDELKVQLFTSLIARRKEHEPVAYLVGSKEFYSLPFVVTPAVLIPRPETELLVTRAVELLSAETSSFVVVDLGTGSGAILLSVVHVLKRRFGLSLLKRGLFLGSDLSLEALRVAKTNARQLAVAEHVHFVASDLLVALRFSSALEHCLIVANLPYVESDEPLPRSVKDYEPELALRGGKAGLEVISRLIKQACALSAKTAGLRVLAELGHLHSDEVEYELRQGGIKNFQFTQDFQGIRRMVEVNLDDA